MHLKQSNFMSKIEKADIVFHLTKKVGNTLTHNEQVVNEFFTQVVRHLHEGKSINIPYFGVLYSKILNRHGVDQTMYYIKKNKAKRKRLTSEFQSMSSR